jgi:putative ABC transport system substrate-binding protein
MLTLVGNWMEIMKEMLPGLKRIAATGNAQPRGETKERDAAQAVASALGLAMCYCPVKSGAELEAVVADARKRDQAIIAFADGFKLGFDERFAEFSLQQSKVQLVVNARTTMAIGITIPPALLARADVVIR